MTNPREALTATVNRAIANGAPVYVNEPRYVVTQLHDGPRFESIKTGFARHTAALAWLIDWLNARGAKTIYPEQDTTPEHSDCWDVMADFGGYAEQFTIEPAKA